MSSVCPFIDNFNWFIGSYNEDKKVYDDVAELEKTDSGYKTDTNSRDIIIIYGNEKINVESLSLKMGFDNGVNTGYYAKGLEIYSASFYNYNKKTSWRKEFDTDVEFNSLQKLDLNILNSNAVMIKFKQLVNPNTNLTGTCVSIENLSLVTKISSDREIGFHRLDTLPDKSLGKEGHFYFIKAEKDEEISYKQYLFENGDFRLIDSDDIISKYYVSKDDFDKELKNLTFSNKDLLEKFSQDSDGSLLFDKKSLIQKISTFGIGKEFDQEYQWDSTKTYGATIDSSNSKKATLVSGANNYCYTNNTLLTDEISYFEYTIVNSGMPTHVGFSLYIDPSKSVWYLSKYFSNISIGDTIGVKIDRNVGKIYFTKDGNTFLPTDGETFDNSVENIYFGILNSTSGASHLVELKTDKKDFLYSVPEGAKSLNEITERKRNGNNFPVKLADDTIKDENSIQEYCNTLTNNEVYLLLTKKGNSYITQGNSFYKLNTSGGSGSSLSNQEILEKFSQNSDGKLLFDGKLIEADTSKLLDKETYDTNNDGIVDKSDIANKIDGVQSAPLFSVYGKSPEGKEGFYEFPIGTIDENKNRFQSVKQNVKTNDTFVIDLIKENKLNDFLIQCYEFQEGEKDSVTTLKEFDNSDSSNFYYDKNNIEFIEDGVKIKNQYDFNSVKNDSTGFYEIDLTQEEFINGLGNISTKVVK